ncbi:MAG: hypothetical protein RL557_844 [archaeon]|jgi:GMP synthase (glutamine-hydrolysing)
MKAILIIDICKERLHYYEFVKPVENIVKNARKKYVVRPYKKLKKKDLDNSEKIIICGTSLHDNEFVKDIEKFSWLFTFNKPVFGICGGMQILGLVYGGKLKKKTEIGFYKEKFTKSFLGLAGEAEVYHLHNYHVVFPSVFDVFSVSKSGVMQAVQHQKNELYGVLFHPEVRNKQMIENFIR